MGEGLILASQSASRKNMLANAGLVFETIPARVDEEAIKTALRLEKASPRDQADKLAETKALKISIKRPECYVLGSDTILDFEGQSFDKAPNLDALKAQLNQLNGRTHRLLSAAVIAKEGRVLWRHIDRVILHMRAMSPAFLETYVREEGDALLSCVGGYRLEAMGVQLFKKIDGDYFSVLGLPLLPLLEQLRIYGILQR